MVATSGKGARNRLIHGAVMAAVTLPIVLLAACASPPPPLAPQPVVYEQAPPPAMAPMRVPAARG